SSSPVFRYVADPGLDSSSRIEVGDVASVESDRPARRSPEAEKCLGQFGLPVSLDARDGQDLLAPHFEAQIVENLSAIALIDSQRAGDKDGTGRFSGSFSDA